MGHYTEAESISGNEIFTKNQKDTDSTSFSFYPENVFLANAVPHCPPILPSSLWLSANVLKPLPPERNGCRELLDKYIRQSFRKFGIDIMQTSSVSSMVEVLEKKIRQYGYLITQIEERDRELTPQGMSILFQLLISSRTL